MLYTVLKLWRVLQGICTLSVPLKLPRNLQGICTNYTVPLKLQESCRKSARFKFPFKTLKVLPGICTYYSVPLKLRRGICTLYTVPWKLRRALQRISKKGKFSTQICFCAGFLFYPLTRYIANNFFSLLTTYQTHRRRKTKWNKNTVQYVVQEFTQMLRS
jgi:hypothetical protein